MSEGAPPSSGEPDADGDLRDNPQNRKHNHLRGLWILVSSAHSITLLLQGWQMNSEFPMSYFSRRALVAPFLIAGVAACGADTQPIDYTDVALDTADDASTGDASADGTGDDAGTEDTGTTDTGDTGGGQVCGNGVAEGSELCDGADLRGADCADIGFAAGSLACRADCGGYVVTACEGACTPDCSGRECGVDPVCGTPCGDCADGTTCNATGQCIGDAPDPICGNGIREDGELCDGTDVGAVACADFGYDAGDLACAPTCQGYAFAACTGGGDATCGNDLRETGEVCDGIDLRGQTCADFGFDRGALACSADCDGFTLTGCSDNPTAVCGNGIREGAELCDGVDVGSAVCTAFGFDRGTLTCAAGCGAYNFDGCVNDGGAVCGNGTLEAGEVCDRSALGGATCMTLGYDRGALGCDSDCLGLDTSGCTSDCVPACGSRECGNDPVCGISCGTCAGTDACNAGICEAPGARGPRFITFNANVTAMTEGGSVVFSVVVTDPDGIDDLIGGNLIDPVTGLAYGSFSTSASEGAYGLTLTWAAADVVRAINFEAGTDETRTFRAVFYDVAGNSATADLPIRLYCEGEAACEGVCTDVTRTSDCGGCGIECAVGASCTAGECTCAVGYDVCGGTCTNVTTTLNCGGCGVTCPADQDCIDGTCDCPHGGPLCGGSCSASSTTTSCGATGCTPCGASQTCEDLVCGNPIEGDLRLLGVEGILQVYHNGEWRGVCDDAFAAEAGEVACRQLGMGFVEGYIGVTGPSDSFWLDDVVCTGTEARLTDCDTTSWGSDNCGINEHVALYCDPAVTPTVTCDPRGSGTVVINEIDFNPPGVDATFAEEFVELYGTASMSLAGYSLVFYDGATGSEYARVGLSGRTIPADRFFVVSGTGVATSDLAVLSSIQDGPDSVRLEHCSGYIADAVAYGTFGAGTTARGEGTAEPLPPSEQAIGRTADGVDTNNNSADFRAFPDSTPGSTNAVLLTFPIAQTGALTAADPLYSRADEGCTGPTSGSYRYEAVTFTNTATVPYDVTVGGLWTGADGFLTVYRGGAFSAASPLLNCHDANDDSSGMTARSAVQVLGWAPGETITAVVSTYSTSTLMSAFTLTINTL